MLIFWHLLHRVQTRFEQDLDNAWPTLAHMLRRYMYYLKHLALHKVLGHTTKTFRTVCATFVVLKLMPGNTTFCRVACAGHPATPPWNSITGAATLHNPACKTAWTHPQLWAEMWGHCQFARSLRHSNRVRYKLQHGAKANHVSSQSGGTFLAYRQINLW